MTTSADDTQQELSGAATPSVQPTAPSKPKSGFSFLRALKHGFFTWLGVCAVGLAIGALGPHDPNVPIDVAIEQSTARGYAVGQVAQWVATVVFFASCFVQLAGRAIALSVLSIIVLLVGGLVALRCSV